MTRLCHQGGEEALTAVWVISSPPISILNNFKILHEIISISSHIIYFILLKTLLILFTFVLAFFSLTLPVFMHFKTALLRYNSYTMQLTHLFFYFSKMIPFLDFYFFGCVGSSLWHAGSSLWRAGVPVVVVCRLSSWGALGAQLPCGTWDLSSLTMDGTRVPCIGRRILNHWTTREVHLTHLKCAILWLLRTGGDG